MLLQTAIGQFLDTQKIIQSEAEYWQVVRAKSAPFFEGAFAIGAVLGGASSELVTALRKVGFLYGEMIQIHDDLKDALAAPASPDWQSGNSLPIFFGRNVLHPDRDLFLQLQHELSTSDSLREAHKILLRSGAVSYCMKQLIDRGAAVRDCVNNLLLADHSLVDELLDQLMRPVRNIFDNLEISMKA
jgi:geranylgeranyl pyrophosphate synthase